MLEINTSNPVISVVIAARNEADTLHDCLQALISQDTDVTYEILVVDNASTDKTSEIAKCYSCKVIYEPNIGQLNTKRRGVMEAAGQIIAILDSDCIPSPKWISTVYSRLILRNKKSCVAVTCYYSFSSDLPLWGYFYNFLVKIFLIIPFYIMNLSPPFVLGGNVAFFKQALGSQGYPDRGGIAQSEIGLSNLLKKSGTVTYAPEMKVTSSARTFLKGPHHFFVKYKLLSYLLPALMNAVLNSQKKSGRTWKQKNLK